MLENMDRSQRRTIPKVLERPGLIMNLVRCRLGKQHYEINGPQFA
jgi:hypothetical protein